MRCDIIIPVWNQLVFTKDCIDSIFKNTDVEYRLIIIDNASDEKTRAYLEGLKGPGKAPVTLLKNEKNVGFIKAVNAGLGASDAPYVCLLNNDTLVTEGWLKTMIDVAEANSDIGIVNPSSNNLGQKPAKGEPIELYAENIRKQDGKFVELGAAVGFCMLIKRAVIDKIGIFDEIYGMGNFEDTDFSRRAVKEGYKCVRACGAYVYHRENSSFNRIATFDEDFKRNKEIFEFRWGRPKRIAYILEDADENNAKKIGLDSMKLARLGNWIWYFMKEGVDVPVHSNIVPALLGDKHFYLNAVFRVLKKKKKFDEIFVSSPKLGRFLEHLSPIHKAKVKYY